MRIPAHLAGSLLADSAIFEDHGESQRQNLGALL